MIRTISSRCVFWLYYHGPLTRYIALQVAHAPKKPGTFSPPPTSKETASWGSRHASLHVRHARAVMHVGIANLWWRGKRSRHSRRMRNPQFYVSGKRPMPQWIHLPVFVIIRLPQYMWSIHEGNKQNQPQQNTKKREIGLTLIPGWISNCNHYEIWDEITYPFPNFDGSTVESLVIAK